MLGAGPWSVARNCNCDLTATPATPATPAAPAALATTATAATAIFSAFSCLSSFYLIIIIIIIISSLSSSLAFRALHFLGFASVFGFGSAACLDGMGMGYIFRHCASPWQMNGIGSVFVDYESHVYISCINYEFMLWKEKALRVG
jgi:hypothetical protein